MDLSELSIGKRDTATSWHQLREEDALQLQALLFMLGCKNLTRLPSQYLPQEKGGEPHSYDILITTPATVDVLGSENWLLTYNNDEGWEFHPEGIKAFLASKGATVDREAHASHGGMRVVRRNYLPRGC